MAWTIVSTDVTATQVIAASDTFTLSKNGSILQDSGSGVSSLGTAYNTSIFIHGEVIARNYGLYLAGTSDGTSTGIGSHDVVVGSTGTITSMFSSQHAALIKGAGNSFTNLGDVYALSSSVRFIGDNSTVTNSGTITSTGSAGVYFNGAVIGGTSTVVNSGTITGNYAIRASNDSLDVTNTGSIISASNSYAIYLMSNGHTLNLINSGLIQSNGLTAVYARDGDDIAGNEGTIIGSVDLGSGNNSLLNIGAIFGDAMGGLDTDTFTNSGFIQGDVSLGNSNDVYDGRGGTVGGEVFGGSGDDIYYLSDTQTLVTEALDSGSDTVMFSGSSYALEDNFENLTLIGGADSRGVGNDLANVMAGNHGDNRLIGRDGNDLISGEQGNDVLRGQEGQDTLSGGFGDDTLRGGAAKDTLNGNKGNDVLRGGSSADKLNGGDGQDTIVGGRGKDLLSGGDDADTFVFNAQAHSTNNSNADVISDFEIGMDLIDLSGLPGDLIFIGSAGFSGTMGEVRVSGSTNGTVRIDVDGDGTTDMRIILTGVTAVDAADFIL